MFGLPVGFGPFVVIGFSVGVGSPEVVRITVGFCLTGMIFLIIFLMPQVFYRYTDLGESSTPHTHTLFLNPSNQIVHSVL